MRGFFSPKFGGFSPISHSFPLYPAVSREGGGPGNPSVPRLEGSHAPDNKDRRLCFSQFARRVEVESYVKIADSGISVCTSIINNLTISFFSFVFFLAPLLERERRKREVFYESLTCSPDSAPGSCLFFFFADPTKVYAENSRKVGGDKKYSTRRRRIRSKMEEVAFKSLGCGVRTSAP